MTNDLARRYRSARHDLFIIVALTGVNILLSLAESGASFLFSAFFPQVATAWAQYGFLGLEDFACIAVYGLLPTAFVFVCALMAKKDPTWVWTATILFILDTLYLFGFIFVYGAPIADFILEIAFHVIILIPLIRGAIAGTKLNKMGENVEEIAAPPAVNLPQHQYQFQYDKDFAKAHGTIKTGKLIGLLIGFFAMFFIACLSVVPLMEIMSETAAIFIMLGLIAGVMVAFFILLEDMMPFTWAEKSIVYLDETGTLCYMRATTTTRLTDMKVENAWQDRYEVTYTAPNGKRKKYVIPNAYPQLELWMDQRR